MATAIRKDQIDFGTTDMKIISKKQKKRKMMKKEVAKTR